MGVVSKRCFGQVLVRVELEITQAMGGSVKAIVVSAILLSTSVVASARAQTLQTTPNYLIQNAAGMRLVVQTEDPGAVLLVVLPGVPTSDHAIEIIFPEHVTAVRHGRKLAEQLYSYHRGLSHGLMWRRVGRAFEYEGDLTDGVHMLARATLEDDGVRFHYEFVNRSDQAYDMIYAVTDPRLTALFHDVRLERTYVHHKDGFDLLASETPARSTMPLDRWLPARYLASFSWPVPANRVMRGDDGITYYSKSRPVDAAFIATLSRDSTWVVASFAPEAGNVWSNPELTCQHVDPQTALAPKGRAVVETKLLVLRGSLDNAFEIARRERQTLRLDPRVSQSK